MYLLRIQIQNQSVALCVVSHCVFLSINNAQIPHEPVSAEYDCIRSTQSTSGQRCFTSREVAILFVRGKADIVNNDILRTAFVRFPPDCCKFNYSEPYRRQQQTSIHLLKSSFMVTKMCFCFHGRIKQESCSNLFKSRLRRSHLFHMTYKCVLFDEVTK